MKWIAPEIPEKATLCSVCKSYQLPLRNIVSQGSLYVALLGFLASCILYIYSYLSKIAGDLSDDKVSILSFDSDGPSNYLNRGPRRVFLLRAEVQHKDHDYKVDHIMNIMSNIEPDQLLTVGQETPFYVPRFDSEEHWQKFKKSNHYKRETIARLPGGLSEQIAIKGRSSW